MSVSTLSWTPHPVLKVPSREACLRMGQEWTLEAWKKREELIRLEKADPLRCGYRPAPWDDACELLQECDLLVIFGGNGASKTWFEADLGVRTLVENPEAMALWLHEAEKPSIRIQQSAVYRYLPPELRPTDDNKIKRTTLTKIKYSKPTGFSDGTFSLPNGSQAVFGSYKQDIEDYEGDGWKLVLADENLPLVWLTTLQYRLPRRGGKMVWGFTPIRGITVAIRHVTAGAKTLKWQDAEDVLPADHQVHELQDWPRGKMPYIQRSVLPRTYIMYWPTQANPWSGYEAMKKMAEGKPMEELERRFFGYARNTMGTLLPRFGAHNVLPDDTRPLSGQSWDECTWYVIIDPELARNFFIIFIAVDRDERQYVYDEWPDLPTYGEWAVPSENANRFNGDVGPAQPRLGWGVVEYKRLILTKLGAVWDEGTKTWDLTKMRELERALIDPRSGAAEHLAEEEGDSSIIFRFNEEQYDKAGNLIGPAIELEPAFSGKFEADGIEALSDLMAYDTSQPITRLLNEPRFYVLERCKQTTWALTNYSKRPGQGGVKDEACKDPVDCCRYAANEELEWVPKRRAVQKFGRGDGRGRLGPRNTRKTRKGEEEE